MNDARPRLLLIDDEERILRSLSLLLRDRYRISATTEPEAALALVAAEPVHVIVCDQKMPKMLGAELLRQVRQRSPNTMRILLTGYSELDAIISSVNEGEIFRYITKPWNSQTLRETVEQAAQIAIGLFAENAAPATAPAPPLVAPAGAAAVLVIDDDGATFEAVRRAVGPSQAVYWAQRLAQAFELLDRHPIGVIVAELLVDSAQTATALKLLKAQYPALMTIAMTRYRDAGTLIELINQGQIFRLLPKPCNDGLLARNLVSALRQHTLLQAAPAQRARHVVETVQRPEEVNLATRLRGLLGRLRGLAST